MPLAVLIIAGVSAGAAVLMPTSTPGAPVSRVTVVEAYPHDPNSFCQGLVMHKGHLLEGTGKYNESRLRLVEIETGEPTVDINLPSDVFGEGVTVLGNTVLQLTWKNGYLITYDAETFERTGTVALRQIDGRMREGWGITHDNKHLIISDGSSTLRFVDPDTFRKVRSVRVKDGFRSVGRLNELEYVNGEILANIWYKDRIARIDPKSGRVKGWLDLTAIRPEAVRRNREAVLNGIAWDASERRLFVTGKNWPTVYQIRF